MKKEAFECYQESSSRAAGVFLDALKRENATVTVVHHNDADGLCAAAALALAFDVLRIEYRLLAIEKIHELIVRSIHAANPGCIIYADLGGQSCGLIGRYAGQNRLIVILDHHLPGGESGESMLHVNPEHFGISGDTEASGAAVAALFARELNRRAAGEKANGLSAGEEPLEGLLALFGVIGAFGDKQLSRGVLSGMNALLLTAAIALDTVQGTPAGPICRRRGGKAVGEIVELLNLLGSIGFYSGEAGKGIDFLLGRRQDEAVRAAAALARLKTRIFAAELKSAREEGLRQRGRFQWVDVKSRFLPMGVKAIGLFLEDLVSEKLAHEEKYVIGFQHFPESIPGVGDMGVALTKVSARVPPKLRSAIERGTASDLMQLIPEATRKLGGIADGCHRFSAASLIKRGKEREFVEALEVAARTIPDYR